MEGAFILCAGMSFIVAAIWLALPIYALIRLKQLDEVAKRLSRLERDVDRELHDRRPRRDRKPAPDPVPEPASEPAADAIQAEPIRAEVAPVVEMDIPAEPPPVVLVPSLQTESSPPEESKPLEAWSAVDWESWLGSRGLGWAAVVLLLFATAFFFKEVFERGWIGPLGRVLLGVAVGTAGLGAGYWQHRKGARLTSQMLTAAGIVLLYLSMYATFGFYHLLDTTQASPLLAGVVVLAFSLAVYYDARGIAVMGVVGALLNPLLLATPDDRYISYFLYLAVVNAGVAGLLLVRRWQVLAWLVILGTQFLYWLWHVDRFQTEKLEAAFAFQLVLGAIWIAHQIAGPMTRFPSLTPDEGPRLCVQATLFAIAGFVLLDKRIHDWIGEISLLVSAVHAWLTWLAYRRRPNDPVHTLVEFGISMGFLAAVMPLEAGAPWVGMCWAVQGLTLWSFSLRLRTTPIRGMALVLFMLAVVHFLLRGPIVGREQPDVPILNTFAMPGLAIAACLVGAAVFARREGIGPKSPDYPASLLVGLGGLALVWLVLSIEAYHYFDVRQQPRNANAALTLVWAVYALLLAIGGLRLRNPWLRGAAMLVFAVAILHFVIVHAENRRRVDPVAPLWNALAFPGIILAAALIGLAVVYRRARFTADSPDFLAGRVLGLAGLAFLCYVLSFEVFDAFAANGQDRAANTALSIFWSVYAILLLTLGLRLPSQPLRWCSLGLFGVTLVKVVTVDMAHLPGMYRVAAFFCLSLMMGAAAWAYQKVKLTLLVTEEKEWDAGES